MHLVRTYVHTLGFVSVYHLRLLRANLKLLQPFSHQLFTFQIDIVPERFHPPVCVGPWA